VELFSAEFFSALAAIVVIDLVLAGDNAIVIALAARNVPAELQRQAIVWGTIGAVVVRSSLTVVVVWLLKIPGLLFVGGALLVWIAYKLLLPEKEDGNGAQTATSNGFWGAMWTIVSADLIMGLDNVLAVAGAAHGSVLLVVLGLLISIPIVVWGSMMLMRFIERFPVFVYVGAGVLAWTAVKMMVSEPLLKPLLADYRLVAPLTYFAIVCGVLWAGFVANHRRLESRITAHLARLAQRPVSRQPGSQITTEGGHAMTRVLIPVDGSPNSIHAVRHIVNRFLGNPGLEAHLLNVQPPFSQHIARFVSQKNRAEYHHEEGEKALRPCKRMLEDFSVPYAAHIEVGDRAQVIANAARRLRCDHIVMATARKNSLTRMIEDSTTNKVLERTTIPVEVIAGDAVSRWERYGIPAGLGALLALLLAAAAD